MEGGAVSFCLPLWALMLHRANHGDDIGLDHAVDLGDLVQQHPVAVGRVVAIELRYEFLIRQDDHICEFAVLHLHRFQCVDRRGGISGVQQLDKQIDIHHRDGSSRGSWDLGRARSSIFGPGSPRAKRSMKSRAEAPRAFAQQRCRELCNVARLAPLILLHALGSAAQYRQ